jgi:hypothetical protein
MRARALLPLAILSALLVALPLTTTASAATSETHNRSIHDSTPGTTSAGGIHIGGAPSGEFGYYLDVVMHAKDGSVPVGPNQCEPGSVRGVLTLPGGEKLVASGVGDLCTTFHGDALMISAGFGKKGFSYIGDASPKPRLVGEGLLSARVTTWFGGQANITATIAR